MKLFLREALVCIAMSSLCVPGASVAGPKDPTAKALAPGKFKVVGKYDRKKIKEGKIDRNYFLIKTGKELRLKAGGPTSIVLLVRGGKKLQVTFDLTLDGEQAEQAKLEVSGRVSRGIYLKIPEGTHVVSVKSSRRIWLRPNKAKRGPQKGQPMVAWKAKAAEAEKVAAAPEAKPAEPAPTPAPAPKKDATSLGELCDRLAGDLNALPDQEKLQRLMVAPFDDKSASAKQMDLGAQAAAQLATCLKRDHGFALIEQQRRVEVLREMERTMTGLVDESKAAEFGKLGGAQVIVVGSVAQLGSKFVFSARAISAETSTVLTAHTAKVDREALAGFVSKGAGEKTVEAATAEPETGSIDVEGRPVEVRLRILADRLASGFAKLPGKGRYERVIVAKLSESGEAARDLELGILISAQLSTFLQRDHNFLLLERERLSDALKEMELGMTGLLDPDKAAQAGKMIGAQAIVVGTVAEAGADFSVNVRLISAETATVLVAESINLPRAGMVALSDESVVLRTRSGSIFRSAIVPGWGQFYNREPIKGGIIIGIEVAIVGTAIAMHFLGDADADLYSNESAFLKKYQNLTPDERMQKALELKDSAETYYETRNILIYSAIGVYLYNVLDAYLFGIDGEKQLGLDVAPMALSDVRGSAAPGVGLGFSY